eukprot:887594-Amorphochlora_amoeboformis.AAC.1
MNRRTEYEARLANPRDESAQGTTKISIGAVYVDRDTFVHACEFWGRIEGQKEASLDLVLAGCDAGLEFA